MHARMSSLQTGRAAKPNQKIHCHVALFLGFFEAAAQLARRVQPKHKQVVCSNKVGRSRLAQRHSRNGPRTYDYSFDVYLHIFFFEVHIRIRRHTNNRGKEQNTNEQ